MSTTHPPEPVLVSPRRFRDEMKPRLILIGVAIALILVGTVGTIIAVVPQIEALLLALAGRGFGYLAFGVAGGVLLFFARRKPPAGASSSIQDR